MKRLNILSFSPLKPQAPAGERSGHPDDAQSAVPGAGGGAVVCPGVKCQAGRRFSPSISAAALRPGGGGARSLDRHPHWTEWERRGFRKSHKSSQRGNET